MTRPLRRVSAVDPFELPEWLAVEEVTWVAQSTVSGQPHVTGQLSGSSAHLGCDLLAADEAYPEPVLPEPWRREAHQAWIYGQVLLVEYDGRLTLAVPGTQFSADLVIETLGRLAKAVGVNPHQYSASMRL